MCQGKFDLCVCMCVIYLPEIIHIFQYMFSKELWYVYYLKSHNTNILLESNSRITAYNYILNCYETI